MRTVLVVSRDRHLGLTRRRRSSSDRRQLRSPLDRWTWSSTTRGEMMMSTSVGEFSQKLKEKTPKFAPCDIAVWRAFGYTRDTHSFKIMTVIRNNESRDGSARRNVQVRLRLRLPSQTAAVCPKDVVKTHKKERPSVNLRDVY